MLSLGAISFWAAALFVGALGIVCSELWRHGYSSLEAARVGGYLLFLINVAIAVFGIWKQQRLAWTAYLIITLVLMLLIGEPTPVSAMWTMAKLL
ncbi:hypothetical protein GWE18_14305 [Bradyrhizobium sp. CSA112]|uniref:hypothetical protein n=1 Tax=Bradyrhizobium sp. CSA112 TaxID=2699170 RepID=UPI0023AEED45|nr:hypothetical protein [Bradyrhizobium sp. CSA112]MDE5454019.1 hypothetical protein [Bradyrhizobium sp. CSA112]